MAVRLLVGLIFELYQIKAVSQIFTWTIIYIYKNNYNHI